MDERELLFSELLHCDRMSLYLERNSVLDKEKSAFISSVLKRRCSGEPIQYILAKTEFMGLEFKVDKNVFIPRPETEILVETAIKLVVSCQLSVVRPKILDLGTGSGCIAISLAKSLPAVKIDAVDISGEALKIAEENARRNNVDINFIQGDLFPALSSGPKAYNLIVSNPPYIPSAEIEILQPELRYEPHAALDGGPEGLDFYRRIIPGAGGYLKKGGLLILEMGFAQRRGVEDIFRESKIFKVIEVIKDYNNIERVIVAKKNG